MFRVVVSGLRARKLRALLTALAVTLGVGLFGASIIYGDSGKAAFFTDLARGAMGVDVVARPAGMGDPGGPFVDRDRSGDASPAAAGGGPTGSSALAAVAAIAGVSHVDGRVITRLGLLDKRGRVITNDEQVGLAVSTPSWPGFSVFRVTNGQVPDRPGEAAIDGPTAARVGITVGDTAIVLDRTGQPHPLQVVGLLDFGASETFADSSVVALSAADLRALADPDGHAEIVVAATPGTDVAALRQQVATVLGRGYDVQTGDELREQIAIDAAKYVETFLTTLRLTALVALTVAFLVVYNTFQILVSQRAREHALLRCVGAHRRQIVGLVVAESFGVGLLASLSSVLVSVLAGYALLVGQGLFGRGLPDYRLVVTPLAIIAPLLVGVTVTVASAVIPAITAGRVSPLAALRMAADPNPPAGRGVRRFLFTLVAALAVAAGGLILLNSGRGQGFDGLPAMIGGSMIVFVAVVLLMPLMVTTLSAPLRWTMGRLFGTTGRLAMGNARRHPIRFAATVTALMVGIAPLTTFAVLLTTAQVQGQRELAENFPVDFVVFHPNVGDVQLAISPALIKRLRARPEFEVVALSRVAMVRDAECCRRVGTIEPGVLGTQIALEVRGGGLNGLVPGTAAVSTTFAAANHKDIGDRLTVGPAGHTWTATIVAAYDDTPVQADVITNWSDFNANLAGTDFVLVRRSDATTAAAAAAALDDSLSDDPLAVVSSSAQRRESLVDSLGRRLIQANVLLGLSLLIAVLGIANTLFLSVLERTRESAILRAVGLTRAQMGGMLLLEAALTALIGAAVGVTLGIGFGWIAASELIHTYGHGMPDVPVSTIAVYVGLAALAGAIASILPARRAARSSIVAAMTDAA